MKFLKRYKGIAVGCAGILLFILAGCATHRDESVQLPESDAVAVQTFSAGEAQRVTLSPGIVFSMRVDVDGLNEIEEDRIRLRQDGSAVLPMVGTVNLSGCSLTEASTRLEELYSRFYQDPPLVRLQFSTDDGAAPWGYVTVLGRVRKPGRVNLPPTRDLTVSGAIQGADGYDTSANLKAVRISRTDPQQGNRQMVINLERIGENGEAAQDIWLRSGDVVYVPETIF